MKQLNSNRMRLVLIGILAAMVLGSGTVKADFTFGEPMNMGPTINTSSSDCVFCFSADGLEMYFGSNRPGVFGIFDLYATTRATTDTDWGKPINLGPTINSVNDDAFSSMTTDGLSLYFSPGNRPGGYGGYDIWVTTRPAKDVDWATPVNLGPIVNSSANEVGPRISTDGLELYFFSDQPGGYGGDDLWVTRRTTINDPWGEPINLGAVVNSSAREIAPFISANGLSLFFCGSYQGPFRPGGFGSADMWVTTRASVNDPWGTPMNLGLIVNGPGTDTFPVISPDGFTLCFSSERPGGFGGYYGDIYQAPIIPIVDLNGDGIVDSVDMVIVVDHWGENYTLCDIGPTPLGDGIVDVEDLVVLSEHLFEQVDDSTLISHWALDEAQGDIAYNSATDCDGTLIGDPVWQPDGGMVAGALQFNGIDDYVSTDLVLNPADGKFSVIAWIQGGDPGQVVISQEGSANWFMIDTEGNLISELRSSRRSGSPILSQTNITDGNWHRIGFVWDGLNRTLYVDGVATAQDTQADLEGSEDGLYIGCGRDMEAGTFWSGLIDDVRIYNRVVRP